MNKILFFHPRNDFSGSTRVLANVIETEYAGQRVEVVTMNYVDGFLAHLSNVHIIPIRLLMLRKRKIPVFTQLAWRFYAVFLAWKYGRHYDTFYINTLLPWYAAIVGRCCHKKLLYHVHEKFKVMSPEVRLAEYVFTHVRATRVYVSQYVQSCYPSRKDSKEIVKYNTLPASFLSAVQVLPLSQRKRNTVLMLASLSRGKGVYTFVEVAKRLPQFSFRLVLSTNREAIDHFLGSDIPANMEWWPVQRDIHPFLRTSDIILNLSVPTLCVETFGMTILEAMAYGIPAIVPDVGGPTEVVLNDYNGYCVDVTNVPLVVSTICKALEEKEYRRLSDNALERLKLFV